MRQRQQAATRITSQTFFCTNHKSQRLDVGDSTNLMVNEKLARIPKRFVPIHGQVGSKPDLTMAL